MIVDNLVTRGVRVAVLDVLPEAPAGLKDSRPSFAFIHAEDAD